MSFDWMGWGLVGMLTFMVALVVVTASIFGIIVTILALLWGGWILFWLWSTQILSEYNVDIPERIKEAIK
jgi:hypothetical protein